MKTFPLPEYHGTRAIAHMTPIQQGIRAFWIALCAFIVLAAIWTLLTIGPASIEEDQPPVSVKAEASGTLNPQQDNPLHGRHVKSVYKILECSDVFHRRPPNLPGVSAGYGQYFLRVDNTKKVGADPEVIGFMELYSARPGSVKPCHEQRDATDCTCDRVANVCYAEPELISYIGVKVGMQHPLFADPYSKMSETTLYSMFKSLCLNGR